MCPASSSVLRFRSDKTLRIHLPFHEAQTLPSLGIVISELDDFSLEVEREIQEKFGDGDSVSVLTNATGGGLQPTCTVLESG